MPKDKSKKRPRLDKKCYEHHLAHLQEELVKLQEWVKQEGLKVVVLFEGRDAAGKGGHQGDHRAPQPPGLPGYGAARPLGPRALPVVLSALCRPPARCWRDGAV